MLKYFTINEQRDVLVPDIECYQLDLTNPVRDAIEAGEVDEDFKLLPSWAKFVAHPTKSKGFFTRVLSGLFLGQGGYDELNIDLQTEQYEKRTGRVSMMFLPANTRTDVLPSIKHMAREVLPKYEVIVLSGGLTYNGKKITNRNAEKVVKEILEKNKFVLIISTQLAQRSFSIPEITELYLAYDRGENGATIQKMSRTLTPSGVDKVGKIFSLSFDSNRDDKFDGMIVETALNHKNRGEGRSLQEAIRDVLRTVDIFKCTQDGRMKMEVDEYLHVAMHRKGISRVLGRIADLSLLDQADITALALGNREYFRNAKLDVTLHGKSREATRAGKKRTKKQEKEFAKAREVIVTILDNIDIIIFGTGNTVLADAMQTIIDDDELRSCIEEEFGVSAETISYLFTKGIINQDWVELIHDNT
jgi:putative intracellular protease/amidase